MTIQLSRTKLRIAFLLFTITTTAAAQESSYMHNRTVMERIPSVGRTDNVVALGNMSASVPGTIGDVYLSTDYRITTFWLYGVEKPVQGLAARLDLQKNEFDVMVSDVAKALPGSKVRSLVWTDGLTGQPQYFVNSGEYTDDEGTPYTGFFQILSEGEVSLLKFNRLVFKAADRNPTHNTGSKDNKFLKRFDLFYAIGNKAYELPKRKGILKLMASHEEEIEKYIKINELNLNTEWHLVILFDYYNSLVKK